MCFKPLSAENIVYNVVTLQGPSHLPGITGPPKYTNVICYVSVMRVRVFFFLVCVFKYAIVCASMCPQSL